MTAKQLDPKVQVLLSYIEQYEQEYNDSLGGLEIYLDNVYTNNGDDIKQAATGLHDDLKAYLQL